MKSDWQSAHKNDRYIQLNSEHLRSAWKLMNYSIESGTGICLDSDQARSIKEQIEQRLEFDHGMLLRVINDINVLQEKGEAIEKDREWLENAVRLMKQLTAERDEARDWARRLYRERGWILVDTLLPYDDTICKFKDKNGKNYKGYYNCVFFEVIGDEETEVKDVILWIPGSCCK